MARVDRMGDQAMMMTMRDILMPVILLLVILVLGFQMYLLLKPAAIPRIVDEHGNNLIYRCPGDARCPTPVAR